MICENIRIGTSGAILRTYILSNWEDIDSNRKRAFVLICPGGCYRHCSNREAEAVAIRFNAMGYNCGVLFYTTNKISKFDYSPFKRYNTLYPTPQIELAEAIKYVRFHSDELNTNPNKIAIMGFSAGGHLVASIGDYWQEHGETAKPNAMVLCYPVITSGTYSHECSIHLLIGEDKSLLDKVSLEKHVNSENPPTFICVSKDDQEVPYVNSLMYADALQRNNVLYCLKIYDRGGHGFSLGTQEVMKGTRLIVPEVQDWPERVDAFLLGIFGTRF